MPGGPSAQACVLTSLFRLHLNKPQYELDFWALQSVRLTSSYCAAEEHVGVSLVFGLPLVDGDNNAGRLCSFIHRFRMRVDLELPGMYNWFADCSLHVTLRAIMG